MWLLLCILPSLYSLSRSPHLFLIKCSIHVWLVDSALILKVVCPPPFLVLTSHPSLSPPPRKAEGGKASATAGPAELPPEYLTSPLSQQSQVVVQETVSEAMATQQLEVVYLGGIAELIP